MKGGLFIGHSNFLYVNLFGRQLLLSRTVFCELGQGGTGDVAVDVGEVRPCAWNESSVSGHECLSGIAGIHEVGTDRVLGLFDTDVRCRFFSNGSLAWSLGDSEVVSE